MEYYTSLQVAQKLLDMATSDKNALTPIQLIKLTYFGTHGWMLAVHNRPLLSEPVEAWQYGPVLPKLHKKIKNFRGQPVTATLSSDPVVDPDAIDVIEQVYRLYGRLSGLRLSTITLKSNHPGITPGIEKEGLESSQTTLLDMILKCWPPPVRPWRNRNEQRIFIL